MSGLRKIPLRWLIIGLGVICYLLHFIERNPSNPYSRPIISDAKGYYAYLPAIFIYQDFDYEFIPEVDSKYYAVGQDKHIFIEVDGTRVNKTFPGISLLYLPFFLIAHFLALLLGLPADGYSDIYQYLFDFGQFFYATLGLLFAASLLRNLKIKEGAILGAITVILLGTNLWYYTLYDQSVTHVYNFFLINLFLWWLSRFEQTNHAKYVLLSIATFSVILIARPTGVLSLLLVPILFQKKSFYGALFRTLKNLKPLFLGLLISGSTLMIPFLLWKVQSGNWVVYSYGDEGFNFAEPHLVEFLFSYAKGWWLYSPLILVSIVLGVWSLITAGARQQVVWFLGFLMIAIYVFSSWWCWYYGFSFGQRPMVDFYIVFIYFLGLAFSNMSKKQLVMLLPLGLFFAFLNIHQSHQQYQGYYTTPTPTKEMYWDNFLSFQKKAKVYYEEDAVQKEFLFDFEEELLEYTGNVVDHDEARNGSRMTYVDQDHEFSGNIFLQDASMLTQSIVVSAYINAKTDLEYSTLVIEHSGIPATYVSYPLAEYAVRNEWVKVEFLYENDWEETNEILHVYFWNQSTQERVFIDDMEIVVLD